MSIASTFILDEYVALSAAASRSENQTTRPNAHLRYYYVRTSVLVLYLFNIIDQSSIIKGGQRYYQGMRDPTLPPVRSDYPWSTVPS
jgi:hypothetical protein